MSLASLDNQTRSWTMHVLVGCGIRARGRSENPAAAAAQVRTAAAWCRCEERTDNAERRPGGSRYEAATSGGEALQRSTRSPGGGAWRRSAGMRPRSLTEMKR